MRVLKCYLLKIVLEKPLQFYHTNCVRGYLASHFDNELLGNREENRLRYSSGLIQYKVIEGNVLVIGIEEGAKILQKICREIDHITIESKDKGSRKYQVISKKHINEKQFFGISDQVRQYNFLTPWLPFNSENYSKYCRAKTNEQKQELFQRIIAGNILSLSKSLGYCVEERIIPQNINFSNSHMSNVKGQDYLSVTGSFSCNFILPQFWGIGRFSTRGYGTIVES